VSVTVPSMLSDEAACGWRARIVEAVLSGEVAPSQRTTLSVNVVTVVCRGREPSASGMQSRAALNSPPPPLSQRAPLGSLPRAAFGGVQLRFGGGGSSSSVAAHSSSARTVELGPALPWKRVHQAVTHAMSRRASTSGCRSRGAVRSNGQRRSDHQQREKRFQTPPKESPPWPDRMLSNLGASSMESPTAA